VRKPGSGKLDFFGFARGDLDDITAGVGLDVEHRFKRDLSLFASGRAWHDGDGLEFDALTGARWRW